MSEAMIASSRQHDPVLIVEDNPENQALLKGVCKNLKIACEIAENGKRGLEMLSQRKYSVFIVDLMMPVMDGETFIKELRQRQPEAVIVVQTALDTSDTIIGIMKMGVYDYIIKPIDPEVFKGILLKSLDYKYLKDLEVQQSLSAGLKIRNQIEWLNYKESRRMVQKDSAESKSIYSVKTSLAQGAGFGALVSMVEMMKFSEQDANGNYIVEKGLVDLITENNDYCRVQLEGLDFAISIMEKDFPLDKHTALELVESIPQLVSNVEPYYAQRNLRLTFPELRGNCTIYYNTEIISLVLEELVVNSYKYAKPGSVVNMMTHISEGYFWLSIKNDVVEEPYGGVPKDYERLVVEPFFRIHTPDESLAKIERIGFGLGLAVTDYVAKKHQGMFLIHDVEDMTGDKARMCTLAELLLPIGEKTKA